MIRIPITTSRESTVREALRITAAKVKLWHEANEAKLKTLEDKQTWSEVYEKPNNAHILQSHTVHKMKRNMHSQPKQFKPIVVTGDYRQAYQHNYDKICAPFVDLTVCLFFLPIALVMGWHTRHLDVKAAFLNGDIDGVLYVMFLYNISNKKNIKTYLLYMSLYDLKQALLLWFTKLKAFLIYDMKCQQLKTDYSVFSRLTETATAKSSYHTSVISSLYRVALKTSNRKCLVFSFTLKALK